MDWLEERKWTAFLMRVPLNKTSSYSCNSANDMMSIRATASMLGNNPECDRVFKITADFDKKEIIVTANKKKQ